MHMLSSTVTCIQLHIIYMYIYIQYNFVPQYHDILRFTFEEESKVHK